MGRFQQLTRKARCLLALPIHEHILQVSWCPASESHLNHRPGSLKPTDQLGGASRGCAPLVPCFQWSYLGPRFGHDQEIADTPANDVDNIFTDRAQVWSDTQGKFFGRERRKSFDQESLISIPTFLERQEIDLWCGH
jgi:hypothetical protein